MIGNFQELVRIICIYCNSEWYCPNYCDVLNKARKITFEKIQKAYERNDKDVSKLIRYIKRYRIKRKFGI